MSVSHQFILLDPVNLIIEALNPDRAVSYLPNSPYFHLNFKLDTENIPGSVPPSLHLRLL